MDQNVFVEIEVTPEAASLLQDDARRRSVGRLISELVTRTATGDHPLRHVFKDIKAATQADGLTDDDIEDELERHRAERRR